nr:integrase, catalytic region, zinc finger, CCHC-type, peptidase aspartic, catalytic [Tanacetum cinerariifolium]
MQTQTSNALHNAIIETGGKDRPPMLALGNYVQWKSRIKRYINTKPNKELIHYYLQNPPYKFKWTEKTAPVIEGSSETTTEGFYKLINELVRNQCDVTNHQVNVQFLLQLQPEWQRFVTLVKQIQDLKTVSYYKLYDVLKQHQNEVNEIRAERITRTANKLALVAQQQLVYHPTHYNQNSSTKSQQATTKNIRKAIVNSSSPTYDQETIMVTEDDEMMANVAGARENLGTKVVQQSGIQCYNCKDYGHIERECQKPIRAKDTAYPRRKCYCVSPDTANNCGPILDAEPLHEDDNDLANERNLLASLIEKLKCKIDDSEHRIECEHLEKELSKINTISKNSESKGFLKEHEKYFEIQDLKAQLQDNDIAISELKKLIDKMKGKSVETKFEKSSVIRQPNAFKSQRKSILGVIPTTSVSRPQLKSNQLEDRVMHNNSQGKKQKVEDHRRNFKFSNNKTSISTYNDSLNAKILNLIEIIIFIDDSRCSKHMKKNLKLLTNFVEKFLGTVKFRNDQIAPILGHGDLVQGTITIKRVYYVEGLNHNLFSVGQLCDADLEVAFRKSTCCIRDLKGNDLLTRSRGTYLYSITLQDISTPIPICLMAKATSSQAWLWHRRLSRLNFDSINLLSKNNIMIGLPKLKFIKDHLCSFCELGKAK